MIPNCPGCEYELSEIERIFNLYPDLYFAGTGLFEKGHLIMIFVNSKGERVIG